MTILERLKYMNYTGGHDVHEQRSKTLLINLERESFPLFVPRHPTFIVPDRLHERSMSVFGLYEDQTSSETIMKGQERPEMLFILYDLR